MYCRKCGNKIENGLSTCPKCGVEIILDKEVRKVKLDESKMSKELKISVVLSFVSLFFSVFPWPQSWNFGTSIYLMIFLIMINTLSLYMNKKAKKELVNNFNKKISMYQKASYTISAFILVLAIGVIATKI